METELIRCFSNDVNSNQMTFKSQDFEDAGKALEFVDKITEAYLVRFKLLNNEDYIGKTISEAKKHIKEKIKFKSLNDKEIYNLISTSVIRNETIN